MSTLKLDEDDLTTIAAVAENGQCGRITKFEIAELVRVYREAASRLQAPAVAEVEVKPLEWVRPYGCETLSKAETIFGEYKSWTHHEANGVWFWNIGQHESRAGGNGSDEAEVQAAAQADYERRIRSALRTGGSE